MYLMHLMHFLASYLILYEFFCSLLAGQRILQYKSDVLETIVLVNPSAENIAIEVTLVYFKKNYNLTRILHFWYIIFSLK